MTCRRLLAVAFLAVIGSTVAIAAVLHRSLDAADPVAFLGDRIVYCGDTVVLGRRAIFVDGSMPDEMAENHPYVYNSFREASGNLADGTVEEPMRVYIAPYVYWVDNPDTPAVVAGRDGREPFGMVIKCENLHFIGLTSDARNVVLASQRGQTQGAAGNFTMFDFHGDGLRVSNLTMGNFCNVDLDYPLKPSLGRRKRSDAITQAHVAYCHGDRAVARNVRFISRLNMNPLNGARRILFDRCHLECTDDALTGNGVYLQCTIDLYGQKPFYTTHPCGAVFLGCRFRAMGDNRRMVFCKASGPLTLVDCSYRAADSVYVGWANYPDGWLRCYQAGFTLNGCRYRIGGERPENTVEIDGSGLLRAFRVPADRGVPTGFFEAGCGALVTDSCTGRTFLYNIYNLLRGDDFWDCCGQRALLERCGAGSPVPTFLRMSHRKVRLQTGGNAVVLRAEPRLHGDYAADASCRPAVYWRVAPEYRQYVELSAAGGDSVTVIPRNNTDETACFCVEAYTADGLCGAVELEVLPPYLPAPRFTERPALHIDNDTAEVDYALDLQGRPDRSSVTWYRCRDAHGSGAIPVAVSRGGVPERSYAITPADAGWHIMAVVRPCHNRSMPGSPDTVVSRSAVPLTVPAGGRGRRVSSSFETDFRTFPTANQPQVLPGFWTVDGHKPDDTSEFEWAFDPKKDMWTYGKGFNGAVGYGLLQAQRGARLMYTPPEGSYGDMELTLDVDPTKTAGQGFGSATGQYMDVCVKFDTRTLTGCGLRIIRTVKYAKAVDFLLVRYDNGRVEPLTEPVTAVCYRTGCTIAISVNGSRLTARVETSTPLPDSSPLATHVDLSAEVPVSGFGGVAIQHTGTCGESTTMLHRMKVVFAE